MQDDLHTLAPRSGRLALPDRLIDSFFEMNFTLRRGSSFDDGDSVCDLACKAEGGAVPVHAESACGCGAERAGRADEDVRTITAGARDRECPEGGEVDLVVVGINPDACDVLG